MNLKNIFNYTDDDDIAILLSLRGQVELSKVYIDQGISNEAVFNILFISSKIVENNRVGMDASSEGFKYISPDFSINDFLNGLNHFIEVIDEKIDGIISHKEQLKNISPLDKNHMQTAMSNLKIDLENNNINLVEASKRMDLIGTGIEKHVKDKSIKIQNRLIDPYRMAFIPFMEILYRGSTSVGDDKKECLTALEKCIKELSRLRNV